MTQPPLRRLRWARAHRIIASRYPPIDLFERVSADPAVWEALIAAEALTNPRVRQEAGEISLVPPEERVTGPGASWVMAAFTHVNPRGSRFSDGSFGVYYAARDLETAIAETTFHFGRLAAAAGDGPRREDFRVLVGSVDARFHDLAALPDETLRRRLLDPDPASYPYSAAWARALRAEGGSGLTYPSVRHAGGQCLAAFRPRALAIPRQERHVQYHWDGSRVAAWFDYPSETWHPMPATPPSS